MPWPIATHRHGEQLVSWYAHRHQSIEDRECLRGGQLVMRSGGGVELRAIPVSFDANNLLGKVLPNRTNDPLQHRQLSWL